jgi:hypothetical protein
MNANSEIDAILEQFPGPIALPANKGMQKAILIGCLVFEFVLVKALAAGEGNSTALLVLIVIVLWQILSIALLVMRRDGLTLTLGRDGFAIRYLLGMRTYAWSEVGDFIAAKSRAPLFDRTFYNNRSPAKSAMERVRSVIGMLRFGRNAALPDTYNLGADRLAQLLTLWRQRALSNQR